jgi:hypothetical protein
MESQIDGNFDNSMRAVADGIKSDLNKNLTMIYNYVNSLKTRDPNRYAVEVEEYRKVYEDSNTNYSDFNLCFGNGSAEGAQLSIDNMKNILKYTEEKLSELYKSGNLGNDNGTDMVVAEGVIQPSNEIVMESVSPVVAMWRGMSPAMRNLVKAGAIAAAIFGAKKLYDVVMDKVISGKLRENDMSEHSADVSDSDDSDLDAESDSDSDLDSSPYDDEDEISVNRVSVYDEE